MHKFTKICFLALSWLLVPSFLNAQPLESNTSNPRNVLGELTKKVSMYRLENGLRVLIYPRGVAPVFSGAVGVRVGGTDEVVGQTGISHMFEHMAFKGTPAVGTEDSNKEKKLLADLEQLVLDSKKKGLPYVGSNISPEIKAQWDSIHKQLAEVWDREAFVREAQKRGASDLNATTDKELTRYFMSLPRSAFEFWCWLESERLLNPVMREFYQERDVVKEEKRMRYTDDPAGKLYESLLQTAYQAHPYRNPVIGYDEDISNLTATDLEAFRKKYYVPGNIAIALVGSLNPEQDIEVIKRYFGRLPAGPLPERSQIVEPAQEGQREFTLNLPAAAQTYIAYHKPTYPHADDPALTLALEMLAGSKTSPLYRELVERKQLVVDAGYDEAPGSAFPNLVVFYLVTKTPHSNQDAIKGFDQVLKKFIAFGITEQELQVAKRRLAISHLGRLKSNISMAVDLVTSELIYNDWKAFLDWYDAVMTVSIDDVRAVVNKYLIINNRTIGFLEPAAAVLK